MTFEAIIKAEMKSRCPEDPLAVGKRAFRHWRRMRAVKVTAWCNFVRWRAYAMKIGSFACGWVEEGEYSGQDNKGVIKQEQRPAVFLSRCR